MKIVVLIAHGMTPKDFPKNEKEEFIRLHVRLDKLTPEERQRHDALENKMRQWPRTVSNDSFHAASQELANEMEKLTQLPVIVGYNEFCAPDCQEAFDLAVQKGATEVIVMTPMMTRGGNHSEEEIPAEISSAQKRYPHIHFEYAWPFPTTSIAQFLTSHL